MSFLAGLTLSQIFTGIGSIAAIAGVFAYCVKLANNKLTKTPEEKKEEVDKKVGDEQAGFEQTGRPQ